MNLSFFKYHALLLEEWSILSLQIAKIDNYVHQNIRSSHLDVFCEKGVLENFAKFTVKHLCQSRFRLDYLLLFLRLPLLFEYVFLCWKKGLSNNCCCSNPGNTLPSHVHKNKHHFLTTKEILVLLKNFELYS